MLVLINQIWVSSIKSALLNFGAVTKVFDFNGKSELEVATPPPLLLIPGFTVDIDYTDIIKVMGDMTGSVSNAEFVTEKDDEQWYSDGIDTRYNHMIKSNHEIMADKCTNSIVTGSTLDLTIGFNRHILKGNERLTATDHIGQQLVDTSNKLYKDQPKGLKHWLKG